MNRFALILLVLMLSAWISCGDIPKEDGDSYEMPGLCKACLAIVPNPDDLEITIPEDGGKNLHKDLGQLAEYYTMTVQISRDLNAWILGIISTVDEILSYPPTLSGEDTCIWGPFKPSGLSPVEMLFSMTKHSDTDYEYLWMERPKDTDEEFQTIWGGHITPSTDTARRGIGNLFIDFTTAQVLDPTWDVSGRIDVLYDTFTDGRLIDIAFDDFVTEDSGFPTDADYHYHNYADNHGEFSFIYEGDFPLDDQTAGILETATQETYWYGDGEGLSTMTISGGDLTGYEFYGYTVAEVEGKECWNDMFERTYYRFQLIPEEGDPIDLETTEGTESDCPSF